MRRSGKRSKTPSATKADYLGLKDRRHIGILFKVGRRPAHGAGGVAGGSAVVYADDEVAFNCGGVEWIVESIAVGDERADRQNYLDDLRVFPETMDFAGGTGGRLAGDDEGTAQAGFGCKPLVDLPAVDGCGQVDGQVLLFDALCTKGTVKDTDFGIEWREGLFADKLQAGAGGGAARGLAAGSG